MIYLAYDGSINGDWIAWYAVTLAAHDPARRLEILHVATREFPLDEVRAKIERIERQAASAGVAVAVAMVPSSGDVFHDLIAQIEDDSNPAVVCGARVRSGGRGYLAGTVSEQLLDHRRFDVVAIRVVQPGLLGAPRRFLFPVAGDPEGLRAGMSLLGRFAPAIDHVHLLHVVMVKRVVFRRLRETDAAKLRDRGWRYLDSVEIELVARTGLTADRIGADVVVSDDWAHETIIAASRHKSQLILMEASRRHLAGGLFYGDPVEVALRDAPCDIAVYRGGGA
ncbi:MAG: universal stress protein [Rhodospirillales bacterium]|nr:universal stress protein [Rhodospirillales bacterium]